MVLQAHGEDLPQVIAWFRDACDTDREAELIFPSSLSKEQRAHVHSLARTVGLGSLASVSRGIGDSRHITVMHTSRAEALSRVGCPVQLPQGSLTHLFCMQPGIVELRQLTLYCVQDQLDDQGRHKATWLYRWARDAHLRVSRDEMAEMVLQGRLTPQLKQLWEAGRTKQKLVIKLCDTIVSGLPEELQVYPFFTLFSAGPTRSAVILNERVVCWSNAEALHCSF